MPEIEEKSYRYLRISIVVLLVGIGVSVVYQTWRQGFLLESVSAYYYTPAQAIFVGCLIALAACMIALKGTWGAEDLFLNLGGMFAAVVAMVPTSRGGDFESAVRACNTDAGPLLTEAASDGPNCPDVQALQEATRANVENNVTTLLVLGLVGLVATVVFALMDRRSIRLAARAEGVAEPGRPWSVRTFVGGLTGAVLVWAGLGAVFIANDDWFIQWGHFVAAGGLVVSVLVVTIANAFRRDRQSRPPAAPPTTAGGVLIRPPSRLNVYALLAWIMAIGVTVMSALWGLQVVTLFWLEIVVGVLFIAFWLVQTVELMGQQSATGQAVPREATDPVGAA